MTVCWANCARIWAILTARVMSMPTTASIPVEIRSAIEPPVHV